MKKEFLLLSVLISSAIFVYLIYPISNLRQIDEHNISESDKPPFFLCILLLIYIITCFTFNGNILKVQTGAPLFLIWAVCWGYIQYNNSLKINLKFQK